MSVTMVDFSNSTDANAEDIDREADDPFFDLSCDLLGVIDFEGNWQRLNVSGEKTLGFTQAEVIAKPFIEFVHPEDRAATSKQIEKLVSGIESLEFENRYRCKNGNYKWFSWKATSRPKQKLAYAIAREIGTPFASAADPVAVPEDNNRFFNLSNDLFCVLSFDGYFKSLNPVWEKTLGFTTEELRSKPFIDFVHPEDHLLTLSEFVKLVRGLSGLSFENRYLCKDGSYRWLLWSATPAVEAHSIYAVAHDMTDRKLAELEFDRAYEETRHFVSKLEMKLESRTLAFSNAIHKLQNEISERRQVEGALEKEREFLNALLNSVDAGIVACDADGSITLSNRAMREFYGLPHESIPASEWSNYYDLYQADGTTPMSTDEIPLSRALNGEMVRNIEITIAPKRGKKRTLVASGEAILDESGNKLGAVVALHDITESKQKEQALQQSAREKTELIRSLREQAQQLQNTLQELQRTQTQLIQSEKMSSLGQLVAGVAHEINNPVNFIYGNLAHANDYLRDLLELLNLYQKNYPNPVQEIEDLEEEIDLNFLKLDLPKLLNSMKVGAERIRQIVLSLRNFSRLNEAEIKEVDIHEGLDNALLILHNRLREKTGRDGIEVVKEYGNLPPVECYPSQLNQAIMNILTNAIDALELQSDRPTIVIRTEALTESDRVEIQIRDNGPGMPSQIQERVFNPFFTTKPVGKGTGLGLSIAYQIVTHKHSGTLSCSSEFGQGTEFAIEIPIRQPRMSSGNAERISG